MIWSFLIGGPWLVLCAYLVVGALRTRRIARHESLVSRSVFLFLEISGFVLLFTRRGDIGVLAHLVVPRTYTVAITGVALTWIGIALALWARWHLGQFWSASVALKEDHKLIRAGPYAHFRHPLYSGIVLAAVGGALAIDEWHCVAGVGLIVLGYWMKARKEEAILAAQFGEAFQEHCRHTGFLIPKFW